MMSVLISDTNYSKWPLQIQVLQMLLLLFLPLAVWISQYILNTSVFAHMNRNNTIGTFFCMHHFNLTE